MLPLTFFIIGGVSTDVMAGSTTLAKSKKIVCWQQNGQTVCGDALPPSEAGVAHTVLSAKTGAAIKTVERAPTEAERLAADKIAKQAKEKQDAKEKQEMAGKLLLSNYPTEADLNQSFYEKEATLKKTMELTQETIKNLEKSLLSRLRALGDQESQRKTISPRANSVLQATQKEIATQKDSLVRQNVEMGTLEKQRKDSLELYRTTINNQGSDVNPR
jgi:Mg2+ and Co2+ transporter CorA